MAQNTALILALFALFSCGKQAPKDFDRIELQFQDSSVPPQYHRSYSIRLQKNGEGFFEVNSYGDSLHEETLQITPEQWEEIQQAAQQLQSGGRKGSEPMPGSSSTYISLYKGEKELYQITWINNGAVKESTLELVELLKKQVSNFAEKRS